MSSQTKIADKVRDDVADLSEHAKEAAKSKFSESVDQASDMAASKVDNAADAARAAANQFDLGSAQAEAVDKIASQIQDFADHIRTTDLTDLAQSTNDLARRHPFLFVGGAALVGFAATRFLKSQDPSGYGTTDGARNHHAPGTTSHQGGWDDQ